MPGMRSWRAFHERVQFVRFQFEWRTPTVGTLTLGVKGARVSKTRAGLDVLVVCTVAALLIVGNHLQRLSSPRADLVPRVTQDDDGQDTIPRGRLLRLKPGDVVTSKDMVENRLVDFHVAQLSSEQKLHILDGDFKVLVSTEDLPRQVKSAFEVVTGEVPFALANPGKDPVGTQGLPRRRLVFAGVCRNRWFVHYERDNLGEVAARSMVMILDIKEDEHQILIVWGGAGDKQATNPNDLRKAIASGQFSDLKSSLSF